MISTFWLEKRKPYWRRLEVLVEQSGRRGVGALAHSELQELGLLYRQIAADLSTVREDPAGDDERPHVARSRQGCCQA